MKLPSSKVCAGVFVASLVGAFALAHVTGASRERALVSAFAAASVLSAWTWLLGYEVMRIVRATRESPRRVRLAALRAGIVLSIPPCALLLAVTRCTGTPILWDLLRCAAGVTFGMLGFGEIHARRIERDHS